MFRETPIWRTSTVVEMCEEIRKTKDFFTLPILADELEEKGFLGQIALDLFRSENPNFIKVMREIAVIYSDETFNAVVSVEELIKKMVEGIHYYDDEYSEAYKKHNTLDYYRVMESARAFEKINDKEWSRNGYPWDYYITEYGSETWQDMFRVNIKDFWKSYSLIHNVGEVKDPSNFFSCSC